MKLIPKSWWQKEAGQVDFPEYCCVLEARETACGLSKVNVPGTNFTEPTDWSSMLMGPHLEFWMKDVRLEYDTLVRMGSWDIVDIPSDTMLLGVRWVFKINRGLLELRRVDSKDQLADLATAPRPWPQLQRMRPPLYG